MKKRIISFFTSLIMIFSLAMVMPGMRASAYSGACGTGDNVRAMPTNVSIQFFRMQNMKIIQSSIIPQITVSATRSEQTAVIR